MSIVADGVKVLVFRTTGASDTKSNNHARCRSVASGSLGSCESAASRHEQQDACFVVRDHSLATRTTKIIQGRARHIGSKIQDGRNARGSPLTGHIA